MPDQPEPKGLTEAELDELESELHEWVSNNADGPGIEPRGKLGLFRKASFWGSFITMARLSLTLQRRAEEAEARVVELTREVWRLQASADRAWHAGFSAATGEGLP